MKVVKIVGIVLLGLIVVAGIGGYIFLATLDLNQYLPQITQQASMALGRDVRIEQLRFSQQDGIGVDLRKLTISDDPKFSKDNFITIERIHLGVDIWLLLSKREIKVVDLTITNPKVRIIRAPTGDMNAQSLGAAAPVTASGNDGNGENAEPVAGKAPLPVFSIQSLSIEHAQVTFEDRSEQLPLMVKVPNVDLKVSNLSLTEPFGFTLDAAVCSSKNNTHVTGSINLDVLGMKAQLNKIEMDIDLSQVDADAVKKITPVLSQVPFPEDLKGHILLKVPTVQVGVSGLSGLSAHATIVQAGFMIAPLVNPIEHLNAVVDMDLNDIKVREYALNIKQGRLSGKGQLIDYMKAQRLSTHFDINDLQVEDLLDQKDYPVTVKGKINGQCNVSFSGFPPGDVFRSLKATGSFAMKEGVIENLNLLKMVLAKVTGIPGLADTIGSQLDEVIRTQLGDEVTVLEKAEVKVNVADGSAAIDEGVLASKGFVVKAQGTVGLDMKTAIAVLFYINPDLSASLVGSVKGIAALRDDQGRIYVPGRLSGVMPDIRYMPDMGYLSKKMIVSEGVNQLEKVLDKNPQIKNILGAILGGQDSAQEPQASNSGTEPAEGDGSSQTKELINNVFKSILK